MTTIVLAPAKINLDLRVIGRRDDGFHEIRTVLQSIALHDALTVRSRPGPFTVRSRSAFVPSDRDNIIWRAACALWSAGGRPGEAQGVAVTLHKRVPVAAGLGGGSSDAASVLRALAAMWKMPLGVDRVRQIAAHVGSDVPYFLEGGTALGWGRGERIRRLADLGAWWVVLAQPPFGISTAEAYRWLAPSADLRKITVRRTRLPNGWRRDLSRLGNDLEVAVASRHPAISEMVGRLESHGAALAAMTGSGSVVFGLFRRRAAAQTARLSIRQRGWRTLLSRTTSRAEFARMTRVTHTVGR